MIRGIRGMCEIEALVPNRIKNIVQQKRSAHHIHFDKTMHDIFSCSEVTCKVRRAFSLEGSFDKINKFFFNESMG